jgi:hypothetical protein
LDTQLGKTAAYGSGLRNHGSIKRMLQLSTKSYLSTGEISRYAEKVGGVAKASNLIKKGAYIGVALDVAATALSIHKACTLGREEECRKAQYVEGGGLIGGIGGSAMVGALGAATASVICTVVFGLPTGGAGALGCAVVGGVVGGKVGGDKGKEGGEWFGEIIYENNKP